VSNSKASHRRQFRFYDEDIKLIELLREGSESDTAVVRRCLKQAALSIGREEPNSSPLYRQLLRSYDPTGQELLYEGSFDDFYAREYMAVQTQAQNTLELAEENQMRIVVLEEFLSKLIKK
jgi:hypothetical protein